MLRLTKRILVGMGTFLFNLGGHGGQALTAQEKPTPSAASPVDSNKGSVPDSGIMHPGGAVRGPRVISSVDAEFTENAVMKNVDGSVTVYLLVDVDGKPTQVRVVHGLGMGLDEKAVEAVRRYKFAPATLNGKPVKVDLYIDVHFKAIKG